VGIAIEQKIPGVYVVRFSGDLDLYTVSEFNAATAELTRHENARILIDFSKLQYVDSSGLAALVGFHRRTQEQKGRISVFGLEPNVKKLFHKVVIYKLFPISESEESALQQLR
jgi:anti-sigma B factor antagonist